MKTINELSKDVVLPQRLSRLNELARDLWWSWNEGREVFRRLDYPLWRLSAHNPVRMLRMISPERLEQAARDPSFLALYDQAIRGLERARTASAGWWSQQHGDVSDCLIAYFSAEFALHQSLPIYAGGLGVLAGDHCREASDLGVPLVGVGFIYPMGYFHQHVSSDGWQLEIYERLNWDDAPIERAVMPDGRPCIVGVPLGHGILQVAVWLVRLGRVTLLLLDTDVEGNSPWDRELSGRLYVSESEARLRQEIVLGVGGVRALRALGYHPTIWHLNEGHAALVVFERIRELVQRGESFLAALDEVRSTTVFTTHTPVPAGHDAFPYHLVDNQLAGFWQAAGDRRNTLLALAGYDHGAGRHFNMTALALRGAEAINGVSRQHRQVTSEMWAPVWPGRADSDRPVRAITNGIHLPTWIAPAMARLFERYLGADWREHQDEQEFWNAVLDIPDQELWLVRQSLRSYLLAFARDRARQRWTEEQHSPTQVVAAGTLLDPSALIIGFARRFTEYKRPELIFHDPDRLAGILNAAERPVQIIFAGKAHPADEPGKHHLQRIYRRAADPKFGGRIAFVDDYDLHAAHFLVQGCDVWLNTPREPLEACGTSGMKASVNGVLHLSVPGGWWAEGYTGTNGWLIRPVSGRGEAAEAEALYALLEQQVAPAFYDRDEEGLPRRWLALIKEAIRTVAPRFCARRMLKDYAEQFYVPLARRARARQAVSPVKDNRGEGHE